MWEFFNYRWIYFRHHLFLSYKRGQSFLERNWIKMAVIAFAFHLILMKDISFSINLNSAQAGLPGVEQTSKVLITDYADGDISNAAQWINNSSENTITPNNTFSNLGFVLNPKYAEKHKVSQKTINYHNKKCIDYIKRYANVAQKEMKKYGIPASIKLAQGLLESNAGDSRLARENNNHFGIKCFSRKCKKGHCSNHTDDTHKDFFRKYKSAWESYNAHSEFLQKERYIHLKELGTQDYKSWAKGLKAAGYATDKRYADKLIGIIEALKLYQYDQ